MTRHSSVGENPSGPSVLGTVWATGQAGLTAQLDRRGYRPDTRADSNLIPPSIAEYAIAAFTRPGELVLDPDCGAGTTLVEALHAGRHTIGLAGSRRYWHLARANVTNAKAAGAPVDGMVLVLDRRPTTLATAHVAGFGGRVDLVLTTLRPRRVRPGPDALRVAVDHLQRLLAQCRDLVRPGGHVVITTSPWRRPSPPGELIDLPGQIVAAGVASGFVSVARCVALTGDLRGQRVHPHSSPAERRALGRTQRMVGRPLALPAHHNVLVFRSTPTAADQVLSMPIPPLPGPTGRRFRIRLQTTIPDASAWTDLSSAA